MNFAIYLPDFSENENFKTSKITNILTKMQKFPIFRFILKMFGFETNELESNELSRLSPEFTLQDHDPQNAMVRF